MASFLVSCLGRLVACCVSRPCCSQYVCFASRLLPLLDLSMSLCHVSYFVYSLHGCLDLVGHQAKTEEQVGDVPGLSEIDW